MVKHAVLISLSAFRLGNPAKIFDMKMLIGFANSMDPDQAWQNAMADLGQNCMTH